MMSEDVFFETRRRYYPPGMTFQILLVRGDTAQLRMVVYYTNSNLTHCTVSNLKKTNFSAKSNKIKKRFTNLEKSEESRKRTKMEGNYTSTT